jgi:hypothetical protein
MEIYLFLNEILWGKFQIAAGSDWIGHKISIMHDSFAVFLSTLDVFTAGLKIYAEENSFYFLSALRPRPDLSLYLPLKDT